MSAILAQKYQDGWRPIYFASRKLTDVEPRWGQTELEARAFKWGAAEKFCEFLVGTPTFQVFTDAKSLVTLFNKASRTAPPRIERQILGMQHLDFTLVYSPGKNIPADFMSRNPLGTESSYLDKVTNEVEESIIKIVKNKENAEASNNLKDATKKDKMMIFLTERILQGDWQKHKKNSLINQFYFVRDNLSVIDDVIYMNDLCIPPYALREDVVKEVHEMGHLCQTKALNLLR